MMGSLFFIGRLDVASFTLVPLPLNITSLQSGRESRELRPSKREEKR